MFHLIITQANGKQAEFFAEGDTLMIGRAPLVNDVCIDDASISRQHAQLKRKKDSIWIKDLQSQNGVLVDGNSVDKSEVKPGEPLLLGSVRLEVYIRDHVVRLDRDGDHLRHSGAESATGHGLSQDTLDEADNLNANQPPKNT